MLRQWYLWIFLFFRGVVGHVTCTHISSLYVTVAATQEHIVPQPMRRPKTAHTVRSRSPWQSNVGGVAAHHSRLAAGFDPCDFRASHGPRVLPQHLGSCSLLRCAEVVQVRHSLPQVGQPPHGSFIAGSLGYYLAQNSGGPREL